MKYKLWMGDPQIPLSPFVGTRPPPPQATRPRPPGLVYAAGVIWCAVGGIGVLGALLIVLLVGVGVVGVFVAIIPALIALVFLHVGVQTVRGRTPDTLGNGIGSIGIGLLGIVAIIGSWVEGVAVFSHGVQSLALLVAGYLALSARADYKRWRERHAAQL